MIGLLITGHGHFATGLGSSLKLIAGESDKIVMVDFEENHSTATLKANLHSGLDRLTDCDGVVILSDLPGGSPFNNAVECCYERQNQKIEVIAGSNLPMIVEGFTMIEDFDEPKDLAMELLNSGKDSIVIFELEEHQDDADEDGI